MKFTSEDLLKAMGLKDGYYITFEDDTRLFEVVQEEKELYLVCDFKKFNFFNRTLNKNFVIIQTKPTLTEDEKVRLRKLPKKWKWIARDEWEDNLVLFTDKPNKCITHKGDGTWRIPMVGEYTEIRQFNNLFQFIKWEDEPYSIEELLKE